MAGNFRSGGHNAKNAALRELTGARSRPWHQGEPVYAQTVPEPPEFVQSDAIALERWQSLVQTLGQARVVNASHGEMLAALCVTWADLVRSRRAFADMGYVPLIHEQRMTATGEMIETVKSNPLIRIIQNQTQQVQRLLGEFGLSPMTQGRVKATPDTAADPFEQFLTDDVDRAG